MYSCNYSNPGTRSRWMVITTLRPLYPRERPGAYCAGGWAGLGVGPDGTETLKPPGLDPRTVQRVVMPTTISLPSTYYALRRRGYIDVIGILSFIILVTENLKNIRVYRSNQKLLGSNL
jgi:hypothetical protein